MNIRTLVMIASAAALMGTAAAQEHGHGAGHGMTVNAKAVERCADVDFRLHEGATVTGEQTVRIGGRSLAIRLGDDQGMPLKVVGSERGDYEVLLCKAAGDAPALAAVRIEQRGNEVSVAGPAGVEWGGYLIVKAPRDGELDLEASNGPVSLSNLAGRLGATVANGPLSLKGVSGTVDVESSNGPVSFTGNSGNVSLVSKNGPLSVTLSGSSWEGGELRTSSKNGPLTLRLPAGYGSGIVVERGARTPFSCPASLCGERPAFFNDEETRIEIGTAMPRIHMAGQNGPISIKVD